MNFLTVGSSILAGQSGPFAEDAVALYSGGIIFPKNAMAGYLVVTGTLPAGASISDCQYLGGHIVLVPNPQAQAANAPIITASFNASLVRKAEKLQAAGDTFEAVKLLLQAQGV